MTVVGQNYPNPFNPTSTITFVLPEDGHATLTVYTVLGEEVAKLVDGVLAQGAHQVTFDASRLAGGMYFYRLRVGEYSLTRRMLLAK